MSDKRKQSQHPYKLRSSAILLENIVTKKEFLQRQQPTCPKLEKKRKSQSVQVTRESARPVGLKGYLSPRYDPNQTETYLQQIFIRVRKIGEGSYGAVYSVISKDDKKMYAVKIVKRYRPPNLLAEINTLDAVDGIIHCIGYVNAWMENNVLFIQLELAAISLHSYSFKKLLIEEEELFQILVDILFALKGMHGIGLLHMDIKPDNILRHFSGRYMLCDFGLSTYYTQKARPYKPSEGDSKYVSSDMLRGEISPAGDIFALGITLFEVGHSIVLPEYGSEWHCYRKGRDLILPEEVRSLSPELTSLISWMMRKNPLERPTADMLLKHPILRQYMQNERKIEPYTVWQDASWLDDDKLSHYVPDQPLDLVLSKYTAVMGQFGDYATNGGRKSWGWTFPDETDRKEPSERNRAMIIATIDAELAEIFPNTDGEQLGCGSEYPEETEQNKECVCECYTCQKNREQSGNTSSQQLQSTSRSLGSIFSQEPASKNVNEMPQVDGLQGAPIDDIKSEQEYHWSPIKLTKIYRDPVKSEPNCSEENFRQSESPRTPEKRKRLLEEVDEFFSERIDALSPITTEVVIDRIKTKFGRKERIISSPRTHLEQATSPKTPAKTLLSDVTNYPSGGSPRKRRVVRQLNLNEEPVKTPKREPESPTIKRENVNVRLNFDDIFENDEKYIQMLIGN